MTGPFRLSNKDVFINCPFDDTYQPIFEAIVFAVYSLGFQARCSPEIDDAGEARLAKITRIIEECSYGIHDISCVALGEATNLPRFNMPLELGLFLGCKLFGKRAQHKKASLILDSDLYRYRASMSDISGQDIHSHQGEPKCAIGEVRDWLAHVSKTKGLPGGAEIVGRYVRFVKDLPTMCKALKRRARDLTFADFSEMVEFWLLAER